MLLKEIFGLELRHTGGQVVTGAGLDQDATFERVFGGGPSTESGQQVTETTPLTVSGYLAAIRLLAWRTAFLPVFVYRRNGNNDRQQRRDHRLHRLVHDEPNPDMTGFGYYSSQLIRRILWGNSFAFIERNGAGEEVAFWPMDPAGVRIDRFSKGRLAYDITRVSDPPTDKPVLMSSEVLHVPAFTLDGVLGMSLVEMAREQVGEAVAAQKFAGGFYHGGANPDLAITVKGKLGPKTGEDFRKRWESKHGSAKRRIAVLGMNEEIKPITMPLKDAQYIESRRFVVNDAARLLGLPPHMIGDLERATFSNITEQNIEFVQALRPWTKAEEEEYNRKLLREGERGSDYIEHVVDALMLADPKTQAEYFDRALQNGWMNRNEVRLLENMNPADGLDAYMQQLSYGTVQDDGTVLGPVSQPTRSKR